MKFSAIGIAVGAALLVLALGGGTPPPPAALRRGAAMMRRAAVSYTGKLCPKCDARHSGRRNAMH